jgi:hypothetical protein
VVVHGCGEERSDAALRNCVRHGLAGAPFYLVTIRDQAIVVLHWLLRKPEVVSLFLLAFFFFPLLWLSQYNYPSGDDYVQFFQAHTLGTLEATRWWYRHWTGRYTSFFLQSLFPGYDAWLAAYKIIPVALFLTGFACLFAFMRAFFGPSFSGRVIFTLTSCTYIFLVALTPDIAEGFYWLAANMQYLGAVFVTLLLLALYIRLERTTDPIPRRAASVLAIVLIALLAGLNEVSLILFICILASISCFSFLRWRRFPRRPLLFIAFTALCGVFSLLAPGNILRAEMMPAHGHPVRVLALVLFTTPYLMLQLVTSTPLLLASALYLTFLEASRDRLDHVNSILRGIRWYWLLALLLGSLTLSAILIAVGGVRTLPPRIENVYVYSIVLAWFLMLTALFVNLPTGRGFVLPRWLIVLLTVAVVAFVVTGNELRVDPRNAAPSSLWIERAASAVLTSGPYATAYLDLLSGRAERYSRQGREAIARFQAAQGGCVEFPPLAHKPPKTLFISVKYPWTFCPADILKLLERTAS